MLSTVEKIIFLKGVSLFRELSSEDLAHIAKIAVEVEFEKNDIILTEGDLGDALYITVEGHVEIFKGEQKLATVGSREPLGEMGILDSAPRSATVIAKEDARMLKIEREDFNDLLSEHLAIARGVIKVLLQRLRKLTEAAGQASAPPKEEAQPDTNVDPTEKIANSSAPNKSTT